MRYMTIRAAVAGAAILGAAWVTIDRTPEVAAQGRGGAAAAPAAPSKPAPARDISGVG